MQDNDYENTDAVCCVLTPNRSTEFVYSFLNEYLDQKEVLSCDYCDHPIAKFSCEEDMVSYYAGSSNEDQLFFWNDQLDSKNMVGVSFMDDGYTVLSVTTYADGNREVDMLNQMKKFSNSSKGLIYYNMYPGFDNSVEFEEALKKS